MPGQKVIDCAVAGSVPNGLLIGRLEIVDVRHLTGPGLGEARQQGLLLGHRHVLALTSAARLGPLGAYRLKARKPCLPSVSPSTLA